MVAVCLGGLLLFAPDRALSFFGLTAFAHDRRGWISLVFLGCLVLLVIGPVESAWTAARKRVHHYLYKKRIRYHFEHLRTDEINVLLPFAENGKTSMRFSSSNGTVQGLVDKRILYRPSQREQTMNDSLAYNLTAEALEFMGYKVFQEMLTKSSKSHL
ncbi:MAG: super-infection exclusion protein B [Candidatus Sulfotelmatobacter sp.]